MKVLKVKLIYIIAIAIAISLAFTIVNTVNTWAQEEKIITEGKKQMRVVIDAQGNVSVSGADKVGSATQLNIVDENGKKLQILNVSDGTIIRTVSSPGCKWFFDGNTWYRICD